MSSTVKSSDYSHSRFFIIRASPCGADGGADGMAAAVEPGMASAGDVLVDRERTIHCCTGFLSTPVLSTASNA